MLGIIDKLHGDGKLPKTYGVAKKSRQNYGEFSSGVPDFIAPEIRYSVPLANGPLGHAELTLAHEIGHWIDFFGIGRPRLFASEAEGDLIRAWREAVERSDAIHGSGSRRA